MTAVADNAEVRVYIKKLNFKMLAAGGEDLMKLLPAWRREKALEMQRPEGRAQSVGAGLLLTRALTDSWKEKHPSGTEKERKAFLNSVYLEEHGKPFLREGPCFSLSHSGKYAAVAVSDIPVGIDLETKNDPELRVTRRMFVMPEWRYVIGEEAYRLVERMSENQNTPAYLRDEEALDRELVKPEVMNRFRDIWTMKEAVLKCTGDGLTLPMTAVKLREQCGSEALPRGGFMYTEARLETDEERPESVGKSTEEGDMTVVTGRDPEGKFSFSVAAASRNIRLTFVSHYEYNHFCF